MPDLVFRYLAEANGLTVGEDFEIEHHAQPLEIVALLASGKARWAVLPEHVATLALRNAGQAGFPVARVVDLQAAWGEATGTEPRIPQAGIVMPAELVESRPDVVAAVQREVAAAVEAITSDPAAVAPGLAESSSLPEAVVADVIPRLNLDVVSGADARAELERFFGELHDRSPDVIGDASPATSSTSRRCPEPRPCAHPTSPPAVRTAPPGPGPVS
ncbi:MAG: hypothetical protein M5U14_21605 [Acidimicrobiia bacterium]|nr:hypothetical protein [Acidimicrobiia bacterium]